MTTWVRGLMVAAAVTTSLFCGFAAVMFLIFNDNAVLLAVQLLAAGCVIAVGTLTVLHATSGYTRHAGTLRLGAAGLVALGVAALAWSIYLGRATGDFEYYMIAFHLALIGQGLLTGWHLLGAAASGPVVRAAP